MNPEPKVSVIIVSWNVSALLRECLAGLEIARQSFSIEVIVVDNNSQDDSVALVSSEYPWVIMLEQSSNLGFARAVNIGLDKARGQFLFLLNPDASVHSDTIPGLVNYAEQHPDTGIIGPKILNLDGTIQNSINRFPNWKNQAQILLKLDRLFPGLDTAQEYNYHDLDRSAIHSVDQVKGAAFMFSKNLVKRIGKFDPHYFLWFEEVDYCYRAKRSGLKVIYFPLVTVSHHGGKSFHQQMSWKKHRYFIASLNYFFSQYYSKREQLLIRLLSFVSYGLHILATPFHPR